MSTNPCISSLAAAAAHRHHETKRFNYSLEDRCPWNRCGNLVQNGAAQTGVSAPTGVSDETGAAQIVDTEGDGEVAGEGKGKEVDSGAVVGESGLNTFQIGEGFERD